MEINVESLVGKLNKTCHYALKEAANLSKARMNYELDFEHYFLMLLNDTDSDIAHIFNSFGIDSASISKDLQHSLDRLKTGNPRSPSWSPTIPKWLETGWVIASIEHNAGRVRSGHLLWAILDHADLVRIARDILPRLKNISLEKLASEFFSRTKGSSEDRDVVQLAGESQADSLGTGNTSGKTKALDQYTVDLTAKAKTGEIDRVIGRDFEIRQVVDILTRRRQNNPILTGEAGVGKTAAVEGFALRIAKGDVPEPLQNVVVRT